MSRLTHCLQTFALAATLAAPVIITSCAVHAGYYDPVYSDYHRWGPPEQAYYNRWTVETHHPHVKYKKLKPDDQRNYWKWRHSQH